MDQTFFNDLSNKLRLFALEHYNVKLKPSHTHEMMAAMCGYRSKNGLLNDKTHSMNNLASAELIVFNPEELLDARRQTLKGLPTELPESRILCDAVFNYLSAEDNLLNAYPPFRSLDDMTEFLLENNDSYKHTFKYYTDVPLEHVVNIKNKAERQKSDFLSLLVFHAYETYDGEKLVAGQTSIFLPRIAGHIGYGHPEINVTIFTGRKVDLETAGAQLC